MDYLFNVFHDTYALYDYFGGDEVFHAAKEAVIEECESSASLTGEILEQSLLKNLTFIKDGHFSINGQSTQQKAYPGNHCTENANPLFPDYLHRFVADKADNKHCYGKNRIPYTGQR